MTETTDYHLLSRQLDAILDGETDLIANLSNASALLNENLSQINWVGFYLMKDEALILGPFQGKPACVHIEVGKGVCGTAVAKNQTQRVADVHAFPGHIACDANSQSEIVIPIHKGGEVIGVLDIDAPIPARFSEADEAGLEDVVKVLETHL
ncbi:GAF domain-containing protein [Staphylococcus pseudintermedius]|uniref:GAF domain-containing protein n=1 Tax=Staphylococcus pseudintermedius TaxID=283734 RepID=UPI0019F948D7|nr:GAF domain-containing protein [Staphylococcus pseudintermedius]EGQ2714667.1 GAF domain-containing protein [Staphylococcus pseudintermedius]EGQ3802744.1 GAF domain-containing protein [Staphylococcus pseudintermedius]EHC9949180.1 GAF domain-containing protein [Staphylococcus pseudintermedius]EHC9976636.1 GAF domain-containing protein [Staphylococcus pseudintermedius]EJD5732231.1 GAF domain-containing protein [Staphylococcus pseudintermedius]